MEISVTLKVSLGKRLVQVGDKVLGACDGVTLEIEQATPEEIIALRNAPVISLVRPNRAENESAKG